MSPDQNVYVSRSVNEKSNVRRRPAAPATSSAPVGETGMRIRRTAMMEISANTTTNICFTSFHVTAFAPPAIVYAMVGTPMNATVAGSVHPNIDEKTTAGAAMIAPHDMPREQRNRNAVRERVAGLKRLSRYSYAVNTRAPRRNGTIVTPR